MLLQILEALFIFVLSIGISTVCITNLVYLPLIDNNPVDDSELYYIIKYDDKYEDLLERGIHNEPKQQNIVMENTPVGNVTMYYDTTLKLFCYTSAVDIPYKYLEVVGKKYVVVFQCPKLIEFVAETMDKFVPPPGIKPSDLKKLMETRRKALETKQSKAYFVKAKRVDSIKLLQPVSLKKKEEKMSFANFMKTLGKK